MNESNGGSNQAGLPGSRFLDRVYGALQMLL